MMLKLENLIHPIKQGNKFLYFNIPVQNIYIARQKGCNVAVKASSGRYVAANSLLLVIT